MAETIIPIVVSSLVSAGISSLLAPNIKGPRLSDRGLQQNAYGSGINTVYGRMMVSGSLVWLENDELKETRNKEDSGKGGQKTVTYTYSMTAAIAICNGPIDAIGRIWADAVLISSSAAKIAGLTDAQVAALALAQDSLGLDTDLII